MVPPSNLEANGAPPPAPHDRAGPMKTSIDDYPKMFLGSPQYRDTIGSVAMMSAGQLSAPQDPFQTGQPAAMRNIPPHHAGFRFPPHSPSPSLASSTLSSSSSSPSLFASRGATSAGSSLRLSASGLPTLRMMMTPPGSGDGYTYNQPMHGNRISSVVSFDGNPSGGSGNATPRPHHHNPQPHLPRRCDSISNVASISKSAVLSRAPPMPRTGSRGNAVNNAETDPNSRTFVRTENFVHAVAHLPTSEMEGVDKTRTMGVTPHLHMSRTLQQDNDNVCHSFGSPCALMTRHTPPTQDNMLSGEKRASEASIYTGATCVSSDAEYPGGLESSCNSHGSNVSKNQTVPMTTAAPTVAVGNDATDHDDKKEFDACATLSPVAFNTKKKMRRRSNVVSPSSSFSRSSSASQLWSPSSSMCSSSSSLTIPGGNGNEHRASFSPSGANLPVIPPPPLARDDSMNPNSVREARNTVAAAVVSPRESGIETPNQTRSAAEDTKQHELPDDDEAAHILLSFIDVDAKKSAPPEHRQSMSPKSVIGDIVAASSQHDSGNKRVADEITGRPMKRASLSKGLEGAAAATAKTTQQEKRPTRLTHADDVSGLNSLHCFVRAELLEIVVIGEGNNNENMLTTEDGSNTKAPKNSDKKGYSGGKCSEASAIVEEEDMENEDDAGNAIADNEEDVDGAHSTGEYGVPSSPSKSSPGSPPPVVPPPRLRLFVGRVGLRCIFCAHLPPRHRSVATMATFYPKSLTDIYRAVCTWQRVHFRTCSHIPSHVRKTYAQLKEQDKTRGKTRYWVTSAMDIGLRDVDKHGGRVGICFSAT